MRQSAATRASPRPVGSDPRSAHVLLALWLVVWAMAGATGHTIGGWSVLAGLAAAVIALAGFLEWIASRPGRERLPLTGRSMLGTVSGFAGGLLATGPAGLALLVWPVVWLAWRERAEGTVPRLSGFWLAAAYLPVQGARVRFLSAQPELVAFETVVLVALVAAQVGLARFQPLSPADGDRSEARLTELVSRYMPASAFGQDQIMAVIETEKARADRYGGDFSVCLFDLDDFQSVCERHGAAAGDEMLQDFADRLLGRMRQMDVAGLWQPGDEPVGPWGGKEFLVVLPGTPVRGAVSFAGRIRRAVLENPLRVNSGPVRTSVSAGVAQYEDDERVQDLLARTDDALASARRDGGGRIVAAGK